MYYWAGLKRPKKELSRGYRAQQINAGRFQPRENFNEDSLNQLTESIKKHGVLSPIIVRESSADKFEIIAEKEGLGGNPKCWPRNHTLFN